MASCSFEMSRLRALIWYIVVFVTLLVWVPLKLGYFLPHCCSTNYKYWGVTGYNFENKADHSLKFDFALANSADHGEMPNRGAFHLLVFTVCQNNLLAVYVITSIMTWNLAFCLYSYLKVFSCNFVNYEWVPPTYSDVVVDVRFFLGALNFTICAPR